VRSIRLDPIGLAIHTIFENSSEINQMGSGGSRPGSGRPRGCQDKRTIAQGLSLSELAQRHAPDAIKELARIMKNSPSDAARCTAINILLDRGYGRPPQSIDVSNKDSVPFTAITQNMTVQETAAA
jgi:hypothetical protein